MRTEAGRTSLKRRGGLEYRSQLAQASIHRVVDGGVSSPPTTARPSDHDATRDDSEHRAPGRLMPRMGHAVACCCAPIAVHQITAFRQSVGELSGRVARAGAIMAYGEKR